MICLVLGGARSGKPEVGERLAAGLAGPAQAVTYLATARLEPADADLADRVARHRDRRDPRWATVDAGTDLPLQLTALSGTVLLDSLGPWLADQPGFAVDGAALAEALVGRSGSTVVISDEVGLGVHPESALGRAFRDALGLVNQAVAEVADQVLLVVAGRVLPLARPGDLDWWPTEASG